MRHVVRYPLDRRGDLGRRLFELPSRIHGACAHRDRRRAYRALQPTPRASGYLDGTASRAAGCGTIRMYGFGASQPSGYVSFASSSETEPAMITSSPCCQLTGVATLWFAVNCSESITRRTSSKFRPVVIG